MNKKFFIISVSLLVIVIFGLIFVIGQTPPPPPVGHCGDGVVETAWGEQCDGTNLNGASCTTLGFTSGTLSCSSCLFDTSGCVNINPSYVTVQDGVINAKSVTVADNSVVPPVGIGINGNMISAFGSTNLYLQSPAVNSFLYKDIIMQKDGGSVLIGTNNPTNARLDVETSNPGWIASFKNTAGSTNSGIYIFAGSTNLDTSFLVADTTGTNNYLKVDGAGNLNLGNLIGTGNALLCVHADGTLYRGTATSCP